MRRPEPPVARPASRSGDPRIARLLRGLVRSLIRPGPATLRYGGNTSCVEVRAGDRRIVLDGGTGLLALGERLLSRRQAIDVDLLLTHFHLDHVCGLPFFAPLF